MAIPNILAAANITAKTAGRASNNIMSNVVVNAVNSSTVVKINSLVVANYSASTIGTYVDIYRSGAVLTLLAGNISIPAYSTMVVVAKDMAVYLEENDSIRANTTANSAAYITSSYEIIT
jgi:hypothetical protein